MLSAADEVRNILALYCQAVDQGDFAKVATLLPETMLRGPDGTEIVTGGEKIAEFYRSIIKIYPDGTPKTKHLLTNIILEPVDQEQLNSISTFTVLQALDGFALQPIMVGHYYDIFKFIAGKWQLAERKFVSELAGEISNHIDIKL